MADMHEAERCVPYRSWIDIMNIGDCLTPYIIESSFQYRPIAARADERHIVGVGSIFFLANHNSYIWGSGVLSDRLQIPDFDAKKITALRGTRTADHLVRCGYRVPDVPFGDPGILVPDFVSRAPTTTRRDRKEIVLIPHHTNYTNWQIDQYTNSYEVDVLDPCTSSLDFIERITAADIVISESLHGLIFASALGKKTTWVAREDADRFKYHDWFSTVDRPLPTPLDPNLSIDELVRAAEFMPHKISVGDLKASFPRDVSVELPTNARVDFRTAREHNPFCFFFHDPHWPLRRPEIPAARFFDLASGVADNIFSTWDERPYAVAINHARGVLPNRQQLAEIVYEMDHYMHHHFAVIATKADVARAGFEMHPLRHGVCWAAGPIDDVGAIVIRPTGMRWGDDFIIFCV